MKNELRLPNVYDNMSNNCVINSYFQLFYHFGELPRNYSKIAKTIRKVHYNGDMSRYTDTDTESYVGALNLEEKFFFTPTVPYITDHDTELADRNDFIKGKYEMFIVENIEEDGNDIEKIGPKEYELQAFVVVRHGSHGWVYIKTDQWYKIDSCINDSEPFPAGGDLKAILKRESGNDLTSGAYSCSSGTRKFRDYVPPHKNFYFPPYWDIETKLKHYFNFEIPPDILNNNNQGFMDNIPSGTKFLRISSKRPPNIFESRNTGDVFQLYCFVFDNVLFVKSGTEWYMEDTRLEHYSRSKLISSFDSGYFIYGIKGFVSSARILKKNAFISLLCMESSLTLSRLKKMAKERSTTI